MKIKRDSKNFVDNLSNMLRSLNLAGRAWRAYRALAGGRSAQRDARRVTASFFR